MFNTTTATLYTTNYQLSEHFFLHEFACFAHQLENGHVTKAYEYPAEWIVDRLVPLCARVLEPIRHSFYDKPIRILSGYRSPELNKALPGTAKNSQHMQGRAADIVVNGISPEDLHNGILNMHESGMIKLGGLGRYKNFVHVDIRDTLRLVRWNGSGLR
jgi:uncharacterized protein YcbK (DUF882 family)